MGAATNLPAAHFLPFFRSLRATGYEGHTCVFVALMDPEQRAQLAEVVDEVVDIDLQHRAVAPVWAIRALASAKRTRGLRRHFSMLCHQTCRLARARPGSEFAEDLEFRLQGLQSLRYAHYLAYLRDRPLYAQVMISDLRDVIFQRDPFADSHVASLEVFLEEPNETFAVSKVNRELMQDLYGSDGLSELGDRIVSCSGVTFGTRDTMVTYLEEMSREVTRHRPPIGPRDQAIHNWLLHSGRLDAPSMVPNGYGRVLTMGVQQKISVASDGTVLNHDGSVPAVLHQYDRHVALKSALLAAF
jgi:hypothetical protein